MSYASTTDIRARFAETDAQGIVHNSVYLVWFELARVEYLERFTGGYPALRDQGVEAIVTESHVRYREPARFDDRLIVRTSCRDIRGARFRFVYEVVRNGTHDRRRRDRARVRRREDVPPHPRAAVAGGGDREGRGYGLGGAGGGGGGFVVVGVVVVGVDVVGGGSSSFFLVPTRITRFSPR